MKLPIFTLLCSLLFLPSIVSAEPWLSTRFSNNCAACHSPGRINLKASKRRCSLSCQGCHVNPNGGGIRNQYGKWNSQRWLKSFDAKGWLHGKKTPAPRGHQKYAKKYPKEVRPEKADLPKGTLLIKNRKKRSIVTLNKTPFKQDIYGKQHDTAFHYEQKKKGQFFRFLTKEDPYISERKLTTTTNTELRYMYLSNSGDASPGGVGGSLVGYREKSGQGFMALDFGLRIRPKKIGLSFVLEQRYLNSPYDSDWDVIFRSGQMRSAYLLWDELPFNTYVMGGIYRPMFGYHSANHRSLRETIAFGDYGGFGGSAGARFAGLSAGATPTIPSTPFFNIHFLTKAENALSNQTEGIVANAGVRFVTLGLSGQVSFWSTEEATTQLKNQMTSISGGMNYRGFIMNAEILNFDQEFTPGSSNSNSGSVITFELRRKVWRESYFTFSYASSNTSITQFEGDSSQLSIGYKLFALAGSEIDLTYNTFTNEDITLGTTDWNSLQLQAHLYF